VALQYIQMDQVLSFLMTGAMVLFFLARESAMRGKGILLAAAGALMGLAFLTRARSGWWFRPPRWASISSPSGTEVAFRKEVAWMAAAFLATALPWYLGLAFTGHARS